MKIAQVAPLYESVPPKLYGGTERVVSYLTEALVDMGHDVTLFASGDSVTKARLIAPCHQSLRLNPDTVDYLAHHILMLEQVFHQFNRFDVIHFHIDYLHFPLSRRLTQPHLTTLHGRLDIPDLQPLYREYRDMPVVSISDDQRGPLPGARWLDTVYHGIAEDQYVQGNGDGGYLAFLGRISPEKRVDRAIDIAIASGTPLRIAAKVDQVDKEYFQQAIEPRLDHPLVSFIGEINDDQKQEFLGNAKALLFPIDWPEPFGMVLIEAMACGTPVIAWPHGSVPEIITHGVNGLLVESVDAAVDAVLHIDTLGRDVCRASFEQRFTARHMAQGYVEIYKQLTAGLKLQTAGVQSSA